MPRKHMPCCREAQGTEAPKVFGIPVRLGRGGSWMGPVRPIPGWHCSCVFG